LKCPSHSRNFSQQAARRHEVGGGDRGNLVAAAAEVESLELQHLLLAEHGLCGCEAGVVGQAGGVLLLLLLEQSSMGGGPLGGLTLLLLGSQLLQTITSGFGRSSPLTEDALDGAGLTAFHVLLHIQMQVPKGCHKLMLFMQFRSRQKLLLLAVPVDATVIERELYQLLASAPAITIPITDGWSNL